MEWFLNTVGTELISAIIGCFIGSGITYKIMYNKYIKITTINQKQKTGNQSKQTQVGIINGNK